MKEIYEVSDEYLNSQLKYLKLLSKQYSSISKASAEIINLKAILNLPKGTEHFLSDIHGEHEAFVHVLKNASGVVKRKIEELFGNTMIESERKKFVIKLSKDGEIEVSSNDKTFYPKPEENIPDDTK